jgi:hypothetical protein
MSKPTKEQLRKWQQDNRDANRPPPSPEQARKELGWDMLEEERAEELRHQKDNK